MHVWESAYTYGAQILFGRDASLLRHFGAGFLLGPNISLVEYKGNVHFVHWSSSRPSWGQILKLDPRRRVKFPMAQVGQEPVIDLSSSYIVEPSIDCQVRKARNERQEVPQQAWDLRTMWLTGLSYGKVPLASMCAICNRSDN